MNDETESAATRLDDNDDDQLARFNEWLDGYFPADKTLQASADAVGEYFRGDSDNFFRGRYFEVLADHDRPDKLTARDLAAVSMLSINWNQHHKAFTSLLTEAQEPVTALLNDIDPTVEIWEAPDLFVHDGAMERLYSELVGVNGIRGTIATKVIAAKRPKLTPILDTVVTNAIRANAGTMANYWQAFARALMDESRRDRIRQVRDAADIPPIDGAPVEVSLLRVIDVVVWMNSRNGTGSSFEGRG